MINKNKLSLFTYHFLATSSFCSLLSPCFPLSEISSDLGEFGVSSHLLNLLSLHSSSSLPFCKFQLKHFMTSIRLNYFSPSDKLPPLNKNIWCFIYHKTKYVDVMLHAKPHTFEKQYNDLTIIRRRKKREVTYNKSSYSNVNFQVQLYLKT